MALVPIRCGMAIKGEKKSNGGGMAERRDERNNGFADEIDFTSPYSALANTRNDWYQIGNWKTRRPPPHPTRSKVMRYNKNKKGS